MNEPWLSFFRVDVHCLRGERGDEKRECKKEKHEKEE
jgi:hypothetical protein